MIPIIKNIRVVDEQGKDYGATYPKRARGLVKNGRARFINDDVICLACPPNKINKIFNNDYLEDIKMNNDIFNADKKPAQEVFTQKGFNLLNDKESGRYNWEYALEKIEKIANDTEYIKEALKTIETIGEGSVDGSGEAKATAIRETIKSREETNRKLIAFYQAMYDDLKPKNPNSNSKDTMKQNIIEKLMSVDLGLLNDPDEFLKNMMEMATEMTNHI